MKHITEYKLKDITDEEITNLVFNDIDYNTHKTYYGIVFGNYLCYKERVLAAANAYKQNMIKKLILSGGNNGVSNKMNYHESEALLMKNYAITLGIPENDLIIEDQSKDTFSNVKNSLQLLPQDICDLTLITSEYHLKRCLAIFKLKYPNINISLIPAKDGYTDKENWYLSPLSNNSGREIILNETKILYNFAKLNQIYNI